MTRFLVQYGVHIDEERRPKDEGFHKLYVINHIYDCKNDEMLADMVNANYIVFIQSSGLTVFKDSTDIREPGTGNITNRMFIPWKMISYLDVLQIKPLIEPQEVKSEASLIPVKEEEIPLPKGRVN